MTFNININYPSKKKEYVVEIDDSMTPNEIINALIEKKIITKNENGYSFFDDKGKK